MVQQLIGKIFGTRHERERRRMQPLIDVITEHGERLAELSDEELREQTPKFRALIAERTGSLEARVAELKAAKRAAADAAERERIDHELSADGGAEDELRRATAEVLDEMLAEAFATVREACRRLVGTTVSVTGHDV